MKFLKHFLFIQLIFFSVAQSFAGKRDKLSHFNLGINYTFSFPYDEDFEKNDYRLSHGTGLSFSTYNDKGWGYTSGIYYSNIISKFKIDFTEYLERNPSAPGWMTDTTLKAGNFKNVKHFLEIPLLMNYTFKLKKYNLKLDLGYTVTYILGNNTKGTYEYLNGNIENVKLFYHLPNERFCLYPTFSVGFEKMFKNCNVLFSPSLRWGIRRHSNYDWLLGFTLGINKSLG